MSRHHYAFAVEPVKDGWRIVFILDFKSRGEADRYMLKLAARYGDNARSGTFDGEISEGDVIAKDCLP